MDGPSSCTGGARLVRRLDTSPNRISWFAVLLDLQRQGLPTTLVAEQIRVPKSTVLGWRQGAEPKHADGEKLVEMWVRLLDRQRSELPKIAQA